MPEFFSFINEILWGSVMIYLLLGAGCWFTWRTGFIQFRYIRQFSRSLKGSLSPQPGGLTSFQALCTSLAARIAAVTWPAWRWLSPQAVPARYSGCGSRPSLAWRPPSPSVRLPSFIKNVTRQASSAAARRGIWRVGWECAGWAWFSPSFCSSPTG